MAANEPGSAPSPGALTSLPRLEDITPAPGGGYDADSVRAAVDAYRRHTLQLQAQLRVLQSAGSAANEPNGHAVRMDALHLIRAAAEFADAIERDAQNAASAQITRTVGELRKRQQDLNGREAEVERHRDESERWRNDILKNAKNEARELLAAANRDATAELNEAEARGTRLLEQARHQATELTNAARAEIDQTLGWAREQASTIIARAQEGAEQLLTAAGLSPEALETITATFLESTREAEQQERPTPAAPSPVATAPQPGANKPAVVTPAKATSEKPVAEKPAEPKRSASASPDSAPSDSSSDPKS